MTQVSHRSIARMALSGPGLTQREYGHLTLSQPRSSREREEATGRPWRASVSERDPWKGPLASCHGICIPGLM